MASPTSMPVPLTMFTTPLGKPVSSITSARIIAVNGLYSLGFATTVQPAAIAGATLPNNSSSG